MLTTFDLDDYVYEALRAGASGFLLKDATAAELVHAVRVVAAGDALPAPAVTRRLIADFARQPRPGPPFPATLGALTHRESEVLRLIARGLSNTEISDTLVIAQQTTKTYVGRILAKLDLRDGAQAVVFAYETGLVTPGGSTPAGSTPDTGRHHQRTRPDRCAPFEEHQPGRVEARVGQRRGFRGDRDALRARTDHRRCPHGPTTARRNPAVGARTASRNPAVRLAALIPRPAPSRP
jgi:DNA-binding CsgD family transcriptional regulator